MASSSSFANEKDLKFVIVVAKPGASFDAQSNTITLHGLRAAVSVYNAGGSQMGTLRAQIFGLTQSDMNTLTSVLWLTPVAQENVILVYAVEGGTETIVFSGVILNAWGVYDGMPEVYLMIEAVAGYNNQVQSAQPTSLTANTDVSTLMGKIASQMGYQFENNGVNITVPKGTYLGGSLMNQARSLSQAFRFWFYLDMTSPNTLAITPFGSPRSVKLTPYVSPQTGLVGYPSFNGMGINFTTIFNSGIVFGGPVQIQSSVPKACGVWTVVSMSHQLSSQFPGGPWGTTIQAVSETLGSQVAP